jgi:ribosomal protein L21E
MSTYKKRGKQNNTTLKKSQKNKNQNILDCSNSTIEIDDVVRILNCPMDLIYQYQDCSANFIGKTGVVIGFNPEKGKPESVKVRILDDKKKYKEFNFLCRNLQVITINNQPSPSDTESEDGPPFDSELLDSESEDETPPQLLSPSPSPLPSPSP